MRRLPTAKRLFTGWAVLVYLFLYLPILVVVIYAFNANRDVTFWTGFTTDWFGRALDSQTYLPAVKTSVRIAAVNAVIATGLGTGAALALARMKRRWRAPFDVLVYLTLVVPEIVIAVATLIFFVQAHAHVSVFPTLGWKTILLAHVVFNASVVTLIVRARFVGTVIGDQFLGAVNWPFGAAMSMALIGVLAAFVAVYIVFATKEEEFGA